MKKGFQRPIYLPFFEDECFDYNNYESMIKAHSKTNLRSYRSNQILSTQRDTTYATHKSDTKQIEVHLLNKNSKKNNMSTDQKFSLKTSDRSKKKPRVSRPRSAKSGKSNRSHQKSRDYRANGRDQTQDAHHEREWQQMGSPNQSVNYGIKKRQMSNNAQQKRSLNRSKSIRASKLNQFRGVEKFKRSKSKEFFNASSVDGRMPHQQRRNHVKAMRSTNNIHNKLNNYDSK